MSLILPSSGCVFPVNNSSKIVLWTRSLGNWNDLRSSKIVTDSTSIYIVGTNESDYLGEKMVFMKYDLKGNIIWNQTWGDKSRTWTWDMGIYNSAIYIAGGMEKNNFSAAFLLKYDLNGTLLWNRTVIGRNSYDKMILDSSSIFLYCYDYYYYKSHDFNISIYQYDLEGNYIMNRNLTGKTPDYYMMNIEITTSSIYVTRTIRLGGYYDEGYLAKYDMTGHELWNRSLGDISGNTSIGITVVQAAIFTSICTGPMFLSDLIISKYSSDGVFLWNNTLKNTTGYLTSDSSSIYFVHTGTGKYTIRKYNQNGQMQWKKTWGHSKEFHIVESMTINKTGIYVVYRVPFDLYFFRISNN
jgi:hypothetical protein